MQIQQIRNATQRITYADKTFLIDPWLAPKGTSGCFRDFPYRPVDPAQEDIAMPMCELPMSIEAVLSGIDAYIVTHVHPDHIDMTPEGRLGNHLDKTLPVFVQNQADADAFSASGFADVRLLSQDCFFEDIALIQTPGLHGTETPCGPSCGVIFKHPNEKTLYVAGDTIWYDGVLKTLQQFEPQVITLNACAAELQGYGRLIMDDADVESVVRHAGNASIVITHMDNVAHASITRDSMRKRLSRRALLDRVLMPEDGETLQFC